MRPLLGVVPDAPEDTRSDEFRRWCRELRDRGYAVRLIAKTADSSERAVRLALSYRTETERQ